MNSVGRKLFVAIALPALAVALLGLSLLWRQTDRAVRESTREEAVGLGQFIATSFGTVDEPAPGAQARAAHRAVTTIVRSNWSAMKLVSDVRIIDQGGVVRWSRRIEEEDKPFEGAARLKDVGAGSARFDAPEGALPWSRGGGGEVLMPLGGVACAGCHTGEATLRTGVLVLSVDEPVLRTQVSQVFSKAMGLVVIFAVVLIAAVAISLRLVLTRPLQRLMAAMKRAQDGDLVIRAPQMGNDELGRLARAFNEMLRRLTELKASEIDHQRDLDRARNELQLKHQIENRVSELQILYDLARTITSTLELNEVMERICALVPPRLNVPKFSIMLVNSDGLLEVQKAHPPMIGSEGLTFSFGEGICGRAAETGKSVYVADLEATSLFKVREGSERGHGSMLSVPMLHRSELLGVLNFERPQKADFGQDDIEFFTAVADQAAMAVLNARLHEQTVALSVTDPLTGVPNRRHLFSQLEAEINRANRFGTQLSMVMIDIDHFKHLNDTAGHSAGDDALRQVCAILKRNVRKVDTLARYGGEEFVVVLPQVPKAEAVEVAEKLRLAVEETLFEYGKTQPAGKVTISVGVSNLPVDATEQARLIDAADSSLYASKRGGRNKVTAYAAGMEMHPGRERGPHAQPRPPEPEVDASATPA